MHYKTLLKLILVRESTGRTISLPFEVPISHVDVGVVRPGEYEPAETERIEWEFESVDPAQPLPKSVDAKMLAELDDYDLLRVTFDVPSDQKAAAATKLRRHINAQFRRSSPGVWSARGMVVDLVGDKDERSQLQLTVTAVPPAQGH